jgi:hypothetical protein
MTTTLTRPALRPLPPPRDGALVAAHHDPRPCVTSPPQWWDSGNRHNPRAINLCRTACPFRQQCEPDNGDPAIGVIRGGVAYDERGKPLPLCHQCQQPLNKSVQPGSNTCDLCRRGRLVVHHARIAELVEAGTSWAVIGRAIAHHPDAVRKYWTRHQQQGAAA